MNGAGEDAEPLSFIDRPPPAGFRLRLCWIAAGCERVYRPAEWSGAIVVLERGRLELESGSGASWRFERGAVLCLSELPLRRLFNPGPDLALISCVARGDQFSDRAGLIGQRRGSGASTRMNVGSMAAVTSADGTVLALDRYGGGPPIIMVTGAFCDRATTEPLSRELAAHATAFNYDRRGRGDSGDTVPYAVEREIEDLAALIVQSGGSAAVFGHSSGANLALRAAANGLGIARLVLYEPPYNPDPSHPPLAADLGSRVSELVAAGRRGDAVELYQREAIGLPEELVVKLRQAPFRPGLERIAHTLAYDAAIIGDRSLPTAMLAGIRIPTLVLRGAETAPFMAAAAQAVADALPDARLTTLAGQRHDIDAPATAAAIAAFLANG